MKKLISSVAVVLAFAAPVLAQDAPPPADSDQLIQTPAATTPVPEPAARKPLNLGDMRHHIYVMEGALARAVDYGAKQLNREILAVMPSVFMLEGQARARGVHLDGYGVFFDVRVPQMRESMVWSLRMMMDQDDAATQAAVNDLRKYLQGITDPAARASAERAMRQLERQSAAVLPRSGNPASPGVVVSSEPPPATATSAVGAAAASGLSPAAPAPPRAAADTLWMRDPHRAYTEAVTRALVDAMIDYSAPMVIGADQWLTVAARDDEGRDSLAPQDPLEEVVTMIYRIKGSDLQQYRAGKIDRDEVRKRVQISQF